MSTYGADMRVRPSAAWYLIPVVLWVAAAVLALVAWKPIIDIVKDGVQERSNNATIRVPGDGLTVYATSQPSGGSCVFVDKSGKSISLSTFSSSINWKLQTGDGSRFYGLGSTPSDLPSGSYTLQCRGLSQNATLGTGQRIDVGDVARVGLLGVIVPIILFIVGLVVLIILLVKRHNSRSRIKAAQAASASGYPGTWGGGYPPPPPGA